MEKLYKRFKKGYFGSQEMIEDTDKAWKGSFQYKRLVEKLTREIGETEMNNGRNLPPEPAKSWARRVREGFYQRYLQGNGLDIGYLTEQGTGDTITDGAIGVDLSYPGYDGTNLPFEDSSQSFVFASHILEHTLNPVQVMGEWFRVIRPSGFLVIEVPHQWLYERQPTGGVSVWNEGHFQFYTPARLLAQMEQALVMNTYRIESLKDLDEGYDYSLVDKPQLHPVGCFSIELVVRKL